VVAIQVYLEVVAVPDGKVVIPSPWTERLNPANRLSKQIRRLRKGAPVPTSHYAILTDDLDAPDEPGYQFAQARGLLFLQTDFVKVKNTLLFIYLYIYIFTKN
jgi:hypothetical protein